MRKQIIVAYLWGTGRISRHPGVCDRSIWWWRSRSVGTTFQCLGICHQAKITATLCHGYFQY